MLLTARSLKTGSDKSQLDIGKEIEKEHKPTYEMIRKKVEETGKLPPPEKVFESITKDHLNENPDDYYEESDQAKKDRLVVPTKKSSFFTVSFIVYMPGHKDSKGNSKPWVIRSHKNNKILGSYSSKEEAKKALKRMRYFKHKGAMQELAKIGVLSRPFRLMVLADLEKQHVDLTKDIDWSGKFLARKYPAVQEKYRALIEKYSLDPSIAEMYGTIQVNPAAINNNRVWSALARSMDWQVLNPIFSGVDTGKRNSIYELAAKYTEPDLFLARLKKLGGDVTKTLYSFINPKTITL